ncbi:hypothetical protein N7532_001227 [Penicillium argentinense]|uniref:HNH nuclease domain-containing protein n=1 Tax=Penicillium argentinense TaxID=1131581 RepID=A0A9W9G3Q3_9EURO|nr:uncharacterized protein N7532_001227 [Penicillium argentinense]KAJ5110692.1 hypothetical protein N7532_001227 [Penicillium argentinense]
MSRRRGRDRSLPHPRNREGSLSPPADQGRSISRPDDRENSRSPLSPEEAQEVLDQRLRQYNPLGRNDNTVIFLRNFFDVLPSGGQETLARDVGGYSSDHKIRQTVDSIRNGLVCPLRAIGGRTPSEITPAPRPGVEDSIENLRSLDVRPLARTHQQQLRDRCLERDGYCCMLTGLPSGQHPHPEGAMTARLEAAHIIPFALGSFD